MRQQGPAAFLITALLAVQPLAAQHGGPVPLPQRLASIVQRYHAAGQFDGAVLVMREGKVLLRAGQGLADRGRAVRNAATTRFPICSLTKQFAAALVMQQVAAGTLTLDGTIGEYLPGARTDAGAGVTIRQLLTHTSGLPDAEEARPDFYTSTDPALADAATVLRTVLAGPMRSAPGEKFAYNNGDYIVLAAILERVTGQHFGDLLRQRILVPLGMRQTTLLSSARPVAGQAVGYAAPDSTHPEALAPEPRQVLANYGAAGAMVSTLDDLARWDEALMANTVLPQAARDTMFAPQRGLGAGALGSWSFTPELAGTTAKPTVVDREGNIGAFNVTNLLILADRTAVIVYSNTARSDLGYLYTKRGLAYDLLSALYAPVQ